MFEVDFLLKINNKHANKKHKNTTFLDEKNFEKKLTYT